METIWKQYLDTQYEVSTDGQVRNRTTGKLLKCSGNPDGYLLFVCYKDGQKNTTKLHRAIAITFLENPENKPTIDHINRDRKDNRLENLRWATRSEQSRNQTIKGTIPFRGVNMNGERFQARITIDGKKKYIGTFDTAEEASEAYNNKFKELYGNINF
jgi:hypothetical protein